LALIRDFTLDGRIGVQADGRGFSGKMRWQHLNQFDTIDLYSPLGSKVVAIDSNATGVNGDDSNGLASDSGAAYVFSRSGSNWTQQAYLKAGNTGSYDNFGLAIAVEGDAIVVGAPGEDGNATGINGNAMNDDAPYSGSADVFVRGGTTWTQQAYLKASNTGEGDNFGYSVAISGTTVVVGAPSESSNSTGVNGNQLDNHANNSGAAYVFTRGGSSWTQQAYLKAGNTGEDDFFGTAVAISGATVVVGAPFESSNATGVNGNGSDNSSIDSGASYVFVRAGMAWSQESYLKASNNGGGDQFGGSVAVFGESVVVGAIFEGSNSTGINGASNNNLAPNSGAVYVFTGGGLPDIAVEQPGGALLPTGAIKTIVTIPGVPFEMGFTLRNTGNRRLYLTGYPDPVSLAGSADFTVTAQPAGTLGAGVSTSFAVRFAPTPAGHQVLYLQR
jgi:hypothetical protein